MRLTHAVVSVTSTFPDVGRVGAATLTREIQGAAPCSAIARTSYWPGVALTHLRPPHRGHVTSMEAKIDAEIQDLRCLQSRRPNHAGPDGHHRPHARVSCHPSGRT